MPSKKHKPEEIDAAQGTARDLGLAGTVWSKDTDMAMRIAERMDTGNVWINEGLALSPLAAFGGRKQSGLGVENGLEGLMDYTEAKTYLIADAGKEAYVPTNNAGN